ncbi:hypothetical protein VB620_03455 [Nodularia harveyana UHCC-0300]|uniref:ARC6 IMS domain-containing protein n=1 Tax=Nodularia harveyana UHCC-0300 TaxID=2974287 RepID=A0ABU5UD92_9CYAN|nr:hypothetical protein [Nodularia harveyana]MEA5580396.1 hypothetical protein [Nodularia harveyana UHCC-0300]
MNEDQEKQKLWKTYVLILGVMLGGPLLIIGGQSVWSSIKQQNTSQEATIQPSLSSATSNQISSTSTNIASESAQPIISRPSTQQFLIDYYTHINNQQYQNAWNKLSPQLRNNSNLHPNGFTSYIEWWGKVNNVTIEEISSEEISNETAIINTKVRYLMKSGRQISQSLIFYVIWDSTSQQWLINQVKRI